MSVRVLVADDSVVMRRLLVAALREVPGITVVGTAANGRIALKKIDLLLPDVLVLDLEMPELDGFGTLAELEIRGSRMPVVVFSGLHAQGIEATLEALSRGASDYVAKPTGSEDRCAALEYVRRELGHRVLELGARRRSRRPTTPSPGRRERSPIPPPRIRSTNPSPRTSRPVPTTPAVVAVGSSTGGPNALSEVLSAIPATFPLPIVIVQHMPAAFTPILAERLHRGCNLSVREGAAGVRLEPGHAYLAPGGSHMEIRGGALPHLALHAGPPENSSRPAVDVLFRSVAEVYGGRALAVMLTGMGRDGLEGTRALAERGAQVVAQDEATSVVWGMPGHVVRAGLADSVRPLPEIAGEILRRCEAAPREAPATSKRRSLA
jgi:two-component system chemotaxis response regulator CheB